MSWNIGENRNLCLSLRTKLGLHHVMLSSSKGPKKINLTVVEMQQLPEVKKNASEKDISCLKWVIYNGRRKICLSFQTDTDSIEVTVYRYRNNNYLKDADIKLSLIEYEHFLQKRIYILSYLETFSKKCIVLDESTTHHS